MYETGVYEIIFQSCDGDRWGGKVKWTEGKLAVKRWRIYGVFLLDGPDTRRLKACMITASVGEVNNMAKSVMNM